MPPTGSQLETMPTRPFGRMLLNHRSSGHLLRGEKSPNDFLLQLFKLPFEWPTKAAITCENGKLVRLVFHVWSPVERNSIHKLPLLQGFAAQPKSCFSPVNIEPSESKVVRRFTPSKPNQHQRKESRRKKDDLPGGPPGATSSNSPPQAIQSATPGPLRPSRAAAEPPHREEKVEGPSGIDLGMRPCL